MDKEATILFNWLVKEIVNHNDMTKREAELYITIALEEAMENEA